MRKPSYIPPLALLGLLLLALPAAAEEESPTESARELMASPSADLAERKRWEFSLEGSWFPGSDSGDAGGNVGMSEARARVARSFRVNRALSFTPELAYSLLHVTAPAAARLPENLHAISAGLRSDYRVSPRLSLNFLLVPGMAGDLREIERRDLRVRLGANVRYGISQRWTLLGGFVYQQGYRSRPFLPIIGGIYRPDQRWTVTLAAPRPGVSYSPKKEMRLNVAAEMAGGEYQLHDDQLGAKVIRYRDFRVVAGADFKIVAGLRGEVAGGYAFARKFSFYDIFDPTRRNLSVDPGPFLRGGVKMEW